MTQTICFESSTNNTSSTSLDINFCDIKNISIPFHLSADEGNVKKIITEFNKDGIIPKIIITSDKVLIDGIDALEASRRLGQTSVLVAVKQSTDDRQLLQLVPSSLLYIHPINSSIYGESEDLNELEKSIQKTNWIEPLIVTFDGERYRIVSGNSRYKVSQKLGIKQVPCEVKVFTSEAEELKFLLAGNIQREKTIEQKVREGWLWEEIEREEAKARMLKGSTAPMENSPGGAVRDIVAKRVGLGSGKTYEHASAAVKEMDDSRDAAPGTVRGDRHRQLKELLSKPRGVDAAYKLVKEKEEPKPTSTKHKPAQSEKWIPKELERIKVTGGEHSGKEATVMVVLSMCAITHIDGSPESKRDQIPFNQMRPLEQPSIPTDKSTSVKEEIRKKQQELGLGSGEQVLPDKQRNEGTAPSEPIQASAINFKTTGDALVTEVAIALLRLSPKQLSEVMRSCGPDFTSTQIEAIYQGLKQQITHKAA
ncbi:ParB/RepB/Spo0J family partition protein [Iningainema tapete]|uniref:ParB N-terminal domain-containing protein n=1 Tax=Iningainema tapete BLCC-T55 TaxID=2748662 RepID=A0A8J6XGC3_9CYAN|nr:ParB N-terminal domain-containing protein [Iningainema tapete]MBD2771199.1 ParB N-terminal domain-containing protein [Iningainema tapete BLCC-T55]